jgi:hypothetical protein
MMIFATMSNNPFSSLQYDDDDKDIFYDASPNYVLATPNNNDHDVPDLICEEDVSNNNDTENNNTNVLDILDDELINTTNLDNTGFNNNNRTTPATCSKTNTHQHIRNSKSDSIPQLCAPLPNSPNLNPETKTKLKSEMNRLCGLFNPIATDLYSNLCTTQSTAWQLQTKEPSDSHNN